MDSFNDVSFIIYKHNIFRIPSYTGTDWKKNKKQKLKKFGDSKILWASEHVL